MDVILCPSSLLSPQSQQLTPQSCLIFSSSTAMTEAITTTLSLTWISASVSLCYLHSCLFAQCTLSVVARIQPLFVRIMTRLCNPQICLSVQPPPALLTLDSSLQHHWNSFCDRHTPSLASGRWASDFLRMIPNPALFSGWVQFIL